MFVNGLWASFLVLQHSAPNSDFRWDPVSAWHYMGIPGKSVVILLLVISVWSVATVINRALTFNAARKQLHEK